MCRSMLHPFLAILPKCEHHIHLEGSLSPTLLFTLASRNRISLPSPDQDLAFTSPTQLLDRYSHFTSLDDFLRYYFIGISVLIHVEDFEALAWEYFVRAKADGLIHAEVFFDPQAHTARGIKYETVIKGFTNARERAEKVLGITSRLILCFLRHLPITEAEHTFSMAEEDFRLGILAGVGLDSSEKGFPPGQWRGVYEKVKALGGRKTAHAGEEGPVEYIREALRGLDVERIDHGIRLVDDQELMQEVAERKLLVTLCPLSNIRLRCVKTIEDLPVRAFLDKGCLPLSSSQQSSPPHLRSQLLTVIGVRFSINSDDPAYFGGYILDNYCAIQEAFSLTVKEWERIARAAVEGSWCDEKRKHAILQQVREAVMTYEHL